MIQFGIDCWSDEFMTVEYHTLLQKYLTDCNDLYRDGKESGLEDCVYDRLYKLCGALDKKYPDNIMPGSPTQYVGKKPM